MQPNLPLFDEPSSFDRERLAARLRELATNHIYVGGSSWKYEGWLGQIYTPGRYFTRGRFSKKRFEQTCLAEYAETFPIVCGDFSFYQFPSEEFWRNLFSSSPEHLQFALKVPEEITRNTFPSHPHYGAKRGIANPTFLDAALFQSAFLQALEPYRARISVLIFEFGTFSRKAYASPSDFFRDLDAFLHELPRGWRYSVEVRNPEYLRSEYFDVLRKYGVAHVFTSWNRMPPLHEQIEREDAYTGGGFTVVRGLLRAGRSYEKAVALFSPYDRVQDINPEAREAMRDLIERSRNRREPLYLFINNRLEGNAPLTIQAVTEPD